MAEAATLRARVRAVAAPPVQLRRRRRERLPAARAHQDGAEGDFDQPHLPQRAQPDLDVGVLGVNALLLLRGRPGMCEEHAPRQAAAAASCFGRCRHDQALFSL